MRSKLAMGGLTLGAAWAAYRRLRKPVSLQGSYAHAPTRILIIGGGFGGLSVARELARALCGTEDVGVALVDRLNYTTFWPMVPRSSRATRRCGMLRTPSGAYSNLWE